MGISSLAAPVSRNTPGGTCGAGVASVEVNFIIRSFLSESMSENEKKFCFLWNSLVLVIANLDYRLQM